MPQARPSQRANVKLCANQLDNPYGGIWRRVPPVGSRRNIVRNPIAASLRLKLPATPNIVHPDLNNRDCWALNVGQSAEI